jgi:hypothetical protein
MPSKVWLPGRLSVHDGARTWVVDAAISEASIHASAVRSARDHKNAFGESGRLKT